MMSIIPRWRGSMNTHATVLNRGMGNAALMMYRITGSFASLWTGYCNKMSNRIVAVQECESSTGRFEGKRSTIVALLLGS